jgi:hypothetical protein
VHGSRPIPSHTGTCERRRDDVVRSRFTMSPARRGATYPRSPSAVADFARRCLRRGVMHPTPHMASGRRLEGRSSLEDRDPGGPDGPLANRRQQWRGNAGRLEWLKVRSRCSGRPGAAREAKATDRDTNRRQRGRRKAAQGTPKVPGSPARGSRGGPAGSPGAGGQPAPGLPRGACVTRRTPAALRGRTARARRLSPPTTNRSQR